ncbi:hypothetical protein HU200_019097 [Digitaria exilis]|uniref:F-box/LRR-repeat protein n=1 Tax=Digitaria exilis TaxID=1010633 RepID=A0A835F446_9POAL|nr:hypothetical protein HU200_019097 [Digitaria exilis]
MSSCCSDSLPHLSIGHTVGNVMDSGNTDCLEFTILADIGHPEYEQCLLFGERLMSFSQSCPVAFKWLTRLILEYITFGDSDIHNLLSTCNKLELLSLTYCDAVINPVTGEEPILTIDAPQSGLLALEVTTCGYARIDLIQVPNLRRLVCANWIGANPPLCFGNVPRLHTVALRRTALHWQTPFALSHCLANTTSLSTLYLNFCDQMHHRLNLLEIVGFALDEKLIKYIRLVMERAVSLKRICLLDQRPCTTCDAMDDTQTLSRNIWRFPVDEEEKEIVRQQLVDGFSFSVEISIG